MRQELGIDPLQHCMKNTKGQCEEADGDEDAERRNRYVANLEAKEGGAKIDRHIASLKPPRCQHETGRDDEKHKPDQARNEHAGKLERIPIEADAGDQPMPDPCRWRKASTDCLFGESNRHEQRTDNGANPEKLFKEKTAEGCVTNQNRDGDDDSHRPRDQAQEVEPPPLPGDLRAETIVGRHGAAEAPQLDPEHDRPDHGGKPAHCDGDRQGCPDNVVESFEKADYGDDAGKADRGADEALRCPVVELWQAPIGACRGK